MSRVRIFAVAVAVIVPEGNMTRSAVPASIGPLPRRGLSRVEAASYLGISPPKFDEVRRDGRMGPAKLLDGCKLFGIEMLDQFFEALPDENHGDDGERPGDDADEGTFD
jgi:hypothetical protein